MNGEGKDALMNPKIHHIIAAIFVLLASCSVWAGEIIYVDDDAPLGGDGVSWGTAYRFLQDALPQVDSPFVEPEGPIRSIRLLTNSVVEGISTAIEIRVAQGVYKPDQGSKDTLKDRTASFPLANGVVLKGGYAGLGTSDPNERDIETYETILSGDLAGDDVVVQDPCDLETEPTRFENSFHVVYSIETGANTLLSGFVITAGHANGSAWLNTSGGGLVVELADMRIMSCTFLRNYAGGGGGVFCRQSNCIFTSCQFKQNCAGGGGGVACYQSDCGFVSCQFMDNAAWTGGGVRNSAIFVGGNITKVEGSPFFEYCVFGENHAGVHGGGVYNEYGCPVFENCLWYANRLSDEYGRSGGGMFNRGYLSSRPQLDNCTFVQNHAMYGRAFACGGREGGSRPRITNCILWEQDTPVYQDDPSFIEIRYSNVRGGRYGKGNIDQDPCFIDSFGHDYHLKSQSGHWDSETETWICDDATSPCIDAGDPNSPIMHEPFPNGGVINMGAYGGTAEASKSYFGKPVCETIVAGDINGDGKVDFEDLVILMRHWTDGGH